MAIPGFATELRSAARTAQRRTARGLWVTFLSPFGLEVAAAARPDWLGLDLQHGDLEVADVPGLLRVAALAGVPTLARLPSSDPAVLARVLDTGVDGVIVPAVGSGQEAAALAAAARTPPAGRRSTGLSRASLEPIGGPPGAAAEDPLLILMIETAEGLEAREAIAATSGVDGIMLGPYDLTLSLGQPQPTSAPVLYAIRSVLEVAERHRLVTALFAGDPELRRAVPAVDLLAVDSDAAALRLGLAGILGDG